MKKKIKNFLLNTYVLFLDIFLIIYLLIKYFFIKFLKRKKRLKFKKSFSNWEYFDRGNKDKNKFNFEYKFLKRFLNLYPNVRKMRRRNLSDFTYEMF